MRDETTVQLYGTVGLSDLLPGLIYSYLKHDLCTCSEAALSAVIEALEQHGKTEPSPPPEVQALSEDERWAFERLRAEFEAGMQMPALSLECKLLKIADSFETPPASEWADLRMGGCDEHLLTLSRLNDMQELVQIRGPGTGWFCELAGRAGTVLPTWIPDWPILFDDIRRNELGIPIGMSGPRPVANRGALERWLGFIFATLKHHEHPALQVRWGTQMGPLFYGLATLDRDLCAASVLAIDLAGLTRDIAHKPIDATPVSKGGKVSPMPSVLPRSVALSGLVAFDLPAIFRCGVELGAALSNENDLRPEGGSSPSEDWREYTSGDEGV
jgi:hypothetical protein